MTSQEAAARLIRQVKEGVGYHTNRYENMGFQEIGIDAMYQSLTLKDAEVEHAFKDLIQSATEELKGDGRNNREKKPHPFPNEAEHLNNNHKG